MNKTEEPKSQMEKLQHEVKGVKEMLEHHEKNKGFYKIMMITIVVCGTAGFLFLFLSSPPITQQEKLVMYRFPRSPKELAQMLNVIEKYKEDNFYSTLAIWSYLYIM